jgi:hypothetical protein
VNNMLRIIVITVKLFSFFCIMYAMDHRELVLRQCVRNGTVPVLYVNDYIVPGLNAYCLLKKRQPCF